MVEAVKVSELVKDLPSLRVVEGKEYLDQKLSRRPSGLRKTIN